MDKRLEEIKRNYFEQDEMEILDFEYLIQHAEEKQRLEEKQNKQLQDFHYGCYTQTCTMNHQNNTEREKGYMAGIRFARKMADRYLEGTSETSEGESR